MEIIEGKTIDEQAKHDKDHGTQKNVRAEQSAGGASAEATLDGEDRRDADHEEEGGEDHVGRRGALPGGVEERREDGGICAGVGDENHCRDCDSAHDVE